MTKEEAKIIIETLLNKEEKVDTYGDEEGDRTNIYLWFEILIPNEKHGKNYSFDITDDTIFFQDECECTLDMIGFNKDSSIEGLIEWYKECIEMVSVKKKSYDWREDELSIKAKKVLKLTDEEMEKLFG